MLILLGFFIAIGLSFVLQNSNLLQASILSIGDYETIKQNKWDIWYKTENQRIEIFCADAITPLPKEIKTTLVFDDNTISWDKGEYQGSINIQEKNKGEIVLTLNNIKDIDCKESLVDIPFEGDIRTLIVDSVFLDQQGTKIWNLNKKTQHWKQ